MIRIATGVDPISDGEEIMRKTAFLLSVAFVFALGLSSASAEGMCSGSHGKGKHASTSSDGQSTSTTASTDKGQTKGNIRTRSDGQIEILGWIPAGRLVINKVLEFNGTHEFGQGSASILVGLSDMV